METMSERVARLLLPHAQAGCSDTSLSPRLSIRDELAIESLALVSVLVDLGAELEIDISESAIELSQIQTVGDLIGLGDELLAAKNELRSEHRSTYTGDPNP